MHGTIQHVSSRDALAFVDLGDIVAFILSRVEGSPHDAYGSDEDSALPQGDSSHGTPDAE
jgi:hypothetical protein